MPEPGSDEYLRQSTCWDQETKEDCSQNNCQWYAESDNWPGADSQGQHDAREDAIIDGYQRTAGSSRHAAAVVHGVTARGWVCRNDAEVTRARRTASTCINSTSTRPPPVNEYDLLNQGDVNKLVNRYNILEMKKPIYVYLICHNFIPHTRHE